jgi:hypothetical protein
LFDVIPDIHGDMDRLTQTLSRLGWRRDGESWSHPEDRTVLFLGDFIDGGTQNRQVLETVWDLLDQGKAQALMGNHELNAIHFHRRDLAGEWMREHSARNAGQHQSFIDEFGIATPEALHWTSRFLELPLWLDLGAFRAVHACWSDTAIVAITRRRPDGLIRDSDLLEIAQDRTDFARAVNTVLKGVEHTLPLGAAFEDHAGNLRHQARIKWWAGDARTWRDAVVSVPRPEQVPDHDLGAGSTIEVYDLAAKPVLFGHYKLAPGAQSQGPNTLCLDYPKHPAAFRVSSEALASFECGIVRVG